MRRLCAKLTELSKSAPAAQPLLHRALKMAREGEDAMQVAKAALKLGRNYEQTKDSETAIQVWDKGFLKCCLLGLLDSNFELCTSGVPGRQAPAVCLPAVADAFKRNS